MKKEEIILTLGLFILLTIIFFYKTVFLGLVPIPGDLLVSEYNPWKTYSYVGYNPGSFPNKAQYFDVLRQLYPWKTFSLDLVKRGELPLWNPYNFSGAPLLANFQSAPFYPLSVVYFLPFFLQIKAWSFLVMLQPLLALFFTYLYAKKIKLSKVGSLFAAISFGFSSFMTVWLEYNTIGHVIFWLPLVLLSAEHLIEKKSPFWITIFIFSLTSSLFAGHIQIFGYLFIFALLYCFFRKRDTFLFFFLLSLLSLGIGAIQWIPGFELLQQSARSPHAYDFLLQKILIQPWQLIMLAVPDFFGNPATRNYWLPDTYVGKVTSIGLIPLLFILFTVIKRKDNFIRLFWTTALIILFLTTINPVTAILYRFEIPFISTSAPTLSIFILCFSLSILSGFGVDIWRKEKLSLSRFLRFASPLILIFAMLWIGVFAVWQFSLFEWSSQLSVSIRNLAYATMLLVAAAVLLMAGSLKRKAWFLVITLLLFLHILDLFRYFQKFNPFSPQELIFPKVAVFDFLKKEAGINRFWGYGTASVEANFTTQYVLFSPDGYDPLYPKIYGEFIQSSKNGKINTKFTTQTRSDAFIVSGFGESDLSANMYRLKILDVLGVKYILDRVENKSTAKTFPQGRFKLVYEDSGWRVFQNLKALSRMLLVSDYQTFRTKEEFEDKFFSQEFDPAKTILLEEKPNSFLGGKGGLALPEPKIESYQPNKIILRTKADQDALLLLSDVYFPGWKAYVDGKETKILKANYAFRTVYLPEGAHRVIFSYEPQSLKLGMIITNISMLGVFFLVSMSWRRSII